MSSSEQFRPLTEQESQILLKLLELSFRGRTELRKQLDGVLVQRIDDNGSLSFDVASEVRAPYERGIAVEAACPDAESRNVSDPMTRILLHLRDGKMWMLEIYRDDCSRLVQPPDPGRFQLFSAYAIASD